jgi:hypothetical protein
MTIDTSKQWWIGSEAADIAEYLLHLSNHGISEYQGSECACSSETFFVEFDRDEGCVWRTCNDCSNVHLICDSAESIQDSTMVTYSCIGCSDTRANVGVGFAVRKRPILSFSKAPPDVQWIWVGVRCAACGILGSIADWKVDYGPSGHLINLA